MKSLTLVLALALLLVLTVAINPAKKGVPRFQQQKTQQRVKAPPCDKIGVDIKMTRKLGGGVAGQAFLLETGSVAKIMMIGGPGNCAKEKTGFITLANNAASCPFFLAYGDAGVVLDGEAHVFECACSTVTDWGVPETWAAAQCQFEIMEAFTENFADCANWASAKKLMILAQATWASEYAFKNPNTKWVQNDPLPINYGFKLTNIGKICLKNKAGDKVRCMDTAADGGGVVKLFDFDKSATGARSTMVSLASFKISTWAACGMEATEGTSFDAIFSSAVFDTLPTSLDGAVEYTIP
jgi:hypothetical protein